MNKAILILGLAIVAAGVLVFVLLDTEKPPLESPPAVTPVAREAPVEPPPIEIGDDAICFDLAYQGLTCRDGEMEYGFAIGYGRPSNVQDTPFIEAVRKRAEGDVHIIYNRQFTDRLLSAVETADRQARRFYFDCDGDGHLSDAEILEPIGMQDNPSWRQYVFVTPDFTLTNPRGDKVPFRAKLAASFYGDRNEPSCMWSPACILEGISQINGRQRRLLLFTGGLEGDYFRYGRASYAFLDSDQNPQYPSRAALSSLVFYEGTFYQLRFDGTHAEGNLRAILVEDTSPTGELNVALQGQETLQARINYATVKGKADETIHFRIQGTQEFPIGQYALDSGRFEFGRDDAYDWMMSFSKGPEFAIEQGKTVTLELGDPTLTIRSVDENKRYNQDVQNLDTFASSDNVYITPEIAGADGETYSRFQKRDGQRFNDVKPHLTIKGPSGQEIVSESLAPG